MSTSKNDSSQPVLVDSNPSDAITKGAQFKNKRQSSDQPPRTVVYADDITVVLEIESADNRHHRYEPRDQFEKGIGNQWEFIGYKDEDSPEETIKTPSKSEIDQIISGLHRRIESYQHDPEEPAPQVREDTLTRIMNILDVIDEISELDLESVNGIGEKTADNLRNAHLTTNIDILCASPEYLTEIDGVGQKTADNLKSAAGADALSDNAYYQ